MPAFVDKAFPELYRWLGEHGIKPSGASPSSASASSTPTASPSRSRSPAPVESQQKATSAYKRAPCQPADTSPSFTAVHTKASRRRTSPTAREQLIRLRRDKGIVHSRTTTHGTTLPLRNRAHT